MENITNLIQKKRSQLHQSVSTPMYLTIEDYEYNENLDTFIYKIEYGIQINQSHPAAGTKGYSNLLLLRISPPTVPTALFYPDVQPS